MVRACSPGPACYQCTASACVGRRKHNRRELINLAAHAAWCEGCCNRQFYSSLVGSEAPKRQGCGAYLYISSWQQGGFCVLLLGLALRTARLAATLMYLQSWQDYPHMMPQQQTHRHSSRRTHVRLLVSTYEYLIYVIKIKIHSSCEIEDFVDTHISKLCVILRSRVLRVVCPHYLIKDIGRRLPLELQQCSYRG